MWSFFNRRLEEVLGAAMLAVMVTVTFVNVIVRYCTTFSFAWTEEITINFFVWVVLLGTARSFREGGNLCMNLLYETLPRPLRLACYLAGIAVCLLFFGALCWTGFLEVCDEIDLEATSESLEIPVWLYTAGTPALSALTLVRILQNAAETLKARKW